MKIIVTGATGFIGTRLVERLHNQGNQITVFARDPQKAQRLFPSHLLPLVTVVGYDPIRESQTDAALWQEALNGCDGVINLAGAPIAGERWTSQTRQRILASRVVTTTALVAALGKLAIKPKAMISGSAIGYYGTDPSKIFEEYNFSGTDFPAQICQQWEAAAEPVTNMGIRLVKLRTGIVLGNGGALAKILPIFQLGLGGILGSGKQWFSWIHCDDLVNLIVTCLTDDRYRGPVNGTAPQPVTNQEFTQALAQVAGKLAILPTPAAVLLLVFGESANLLLEGQQVIPRKAIANNFAFQYPDITGAVTQVIKQ
ncbi:MAG: TIGR01777 family oxidoreductase [Pseudanabaena sp. ELA607]